MRIAADPGVMSTTITLGALEPGATYWRYDDGARTGAQITADAAGKYTFTQDLTEVHTIRIQAGRSTHYIYDDGPSGTGGHCSQIGTWNSASKVCTLTGNVDDSIYLYSSDVTLDGAGFEVTHPYWSLGVQVEGSNNTVKNITINSAFSGGAYGLYLWRAPNTTVSNVTISGAYYALYVWDSDNSVVQDVVTTSTPYGVLLYYTDNTKISHSTWAGHGYGYGVLVSSGSGNTISNNTFSDFGYGVLLDGYLYSYDYWWFDQHYVGTEDYSSRNNTVYRNNFLRTINPIYLTQFSPNPSVYSWDDRVCCGFPHYGSRTQDSSSNTGNMFSLPAPDGGNYYSQFDTPTEGCQNSNADSFCDAGFVGVGAAIDNLPYTAGIGFDTDSPTSAPTQSPVANGAGWNKEDETVSWNWTDNSGGSGVDLANCTTSSTSSGQDDSIVLTATCNDLAGNTGTASHTVKVDKVAPTISAAATTAPNAAGWYNGNVTIAFNCADNLSGIPTCPAAQTLSAQGEAVASAAQTVTDAAGNTSVPSNIVVVKIDTTGPAVTLSGGPAGDSSHYFGAVPTIPSCSGSDALSGLATCLISGYGTAVGAYTVTATATDKAGNQSATSRRYTVLPWTFNGFYQPVDMGGIANTVKNGSTVPIKFEVFAGPTELIDVSAVYSMTPTPVACDGGLADEIELLATGGTSLRYDATAGQFIYNWQTPKKPGACYLVTVKLNDGTSKSAEFKLR